MFELTHPIPKAMQVKRTQTNPNGRFNDEFTKRVRSHHQCWKVVMEGREQQQCCRLGSWQAAERKLQLAGQAWRQQWGAAWRHSLTGST